MTTSTPTLSAVIIARNEEATIRQSINSILAQTVPISEVIVVDGNSKDKTARYVSDIETQDGRVRLVVEDPDAIESGPAAARNIGASLATGQVLLFVNGDVTIGQDYVSRLLSLMDEQGLDAAAGLRWNVRSSAVSGLMNVHYAMNYNSSPETLASPAFLSGDALVIKSEIFWKVGGYDPNLPAGEDADLGYRLRGSGSRLGYCAEATVWHEGQHYRTFADWVQQLEWYGRGAAALAQVHSWRMDRERDGLQRHILFPASALLGFLLVAIILANLFGPLSWAVGAVAFTGAGLKYVKTAKHVQRRCGSVELPTEPLPLDILLYPLFKFARYTLLSAFTWKALLADRNHERRRRRTGDGAF